MKKLDRNQLISKLISKYVLKVGTYYVHGSGLSLGIQQRMRHSGFLMGRGTWHGRRAAVEIKYASQAFGRMFAARHHFPPSMPLQNTVDLSATAYPAGHMIKHALY